MPKFKVGPVNVRAARGPEDGRYYWRWAVYRDGDEQNGSLGWARYEDAERLVIAKVAAGEILTEKRPKVGVLPTTMADLMEVWLYAESQRADLKPKTVTTTTHYAQKIAGVVGNVRIHEMSYAHLERYRDERGRLGAATNSILHEIGILRRAWNWGRYRGYCPDRELPRPKVKVRSKRPKETPTLEHVELILAQMDPDRWPFLAVLLITETGMRIGEIADLRWRDVDFHKNVLHVPESGKTGTREALVSASTMTLLQRRRAGASPDRYVLGVHAGTARTSLSQRHLPRACKAAGVPDYKPHGLRRLVVAVLYEHGSDPTVAGCILGHAPTTAARYYRQVSEPRKRKAVAAAGLLGFADNVIALRLTPVDVEGDESRTDCMGHAQAVEVQ